MKNRAAVLYEQGKPRPCADNTPRVIESLDLAPPGEDEVLIEIRAAGLCHSDLSGIEGARPRALPMVIGHEAAGIVREIGANVSEVRDREHVETSFVSACGACEACRCGRANLCAAHWSTRNSGALPSGTRRLSLDASPEKRRRRIFQAQRRLRPARRRRDGPTGIAAPCREFNACAEVSSLCGRTFPPDVDRSHRVKWHSGPLSGLAGRSGGLFVNPHTTPGDPEAV